jgi:hypothetical protein
MGRMDGRSGEDAMMKLVAGLFLFWPLVVIDAVGVPPDKKEKASQWRVLVPLFRNVMGNW